MTWIKGLSSQFGVTEEAFRLVWGIIFSYPILIFYRKNLSKCTAGIQHGFFVLSGMVMAVWAFGTEAIVHSSICIGATYSTISLFKGSFVSTLGIFIFNFGYLLIGYYYTETDTYDICWTMPHCVLCLRLIAVAMDVHDGTKDEDTMVGQDQKMNNLKKPPSLLEMFSQAFFLGGFFIGPQFSMRQFQNFVRSNLEGNIPSNMAYGAQRVLIGFIYLSVHCFGSQHFPLEWIMSEHIKEMPLWMYVLSIFIWVKIMMSKYIGCWLLSEGAMVFSGMAYNGKDESGKELWDGGANVKLWAWEFSSKLGHIIESFNIKTNRWSASYVYKRFKFMNSRIFSQCMTLAFLSAWHGLHSGYYLTFLNEFLLVNFEKDMELITAKNSTVRKLLTHPIAQTMVWILGKLYVVIFLPQCFVPFGLLTYDKYWPVVVSSRMNLTLWFVTWIPIFLLTKPLLIQQQKSSKDTQ